MTIQSAIRTDNLTTRHAGFARVFQPGRLTFGFIAPLEGYPDRPAPTMRDHLAMARKADDAGFAAVWLRDVPFFDPSFGDVGQVFDPMVYAGFLAGVTSKISIGTAGIIMQVLANELMPLRSSNSEEGV
jgi:hypothetical protein